MSSARRRALLAFLAAVAAIVGLFGAASPASAAQVHFSGRYLEQYDPGEPPIIALVDHTSQNPNYWHVRDWEFPKWGTPLNASNGVRPMFQITDDCDLWPNRVCWIVVERNMSSPGNVDGCSWSAYDPNFIIGVTCQQDGHYDISGKARYHKVVQVMNSARRGDSNAVRTATSTHEAGHGWGLDHSSDSTYLMYATTDGNPNVPRGDEYGCVYQIYNAPPCTSDDTAARSATSPLATGDKPPNVTYGDYAP